MQPVTISYVLSFWTASVAQQGESTVQPTQIPTNPVPTSHSTDSGSCDCPTSSDPPPTCPPIETHHNWLTHPYWPPVETYLKTAHQENTGFKTKCVNMWLNINASWQEWLAISYGPVQIINKAFQFQTTNCYCIVVESIVAWLFHWCQAVLLPVATFCLSLLMLLAGI